MLFALHGNGLELGIGPGLIDVTTKLEFNWCGANNLREQSLWVVYRTESGWSVCPSVLIEGLRCKLLLLDIVLEGSSSFSSIQPSICEFGYLCDLSRDLSF